MFSLEVRLETAIKGLVYAQRNHHGQMIILKNIDKRKGIKNSWGSGHWGNSWRKCPAPSCRVAASAEKVAKGLSYA